MNDETISIQINDFIELLNYDLHKDNKVKIASCFGTGICNLY